MNRIETIGNGAVSLPLLGCGTWQLTDREEMKTVVNEAFALGYRLFDLAAAYGNEISFRRAISDNRIPRESLIVSDKVWNTSRGYDNVREACRRSLQKLKTDYLDLYLIHWPASKKLYENWEEINADTWRGMESLVKDGLVRNIGVCNFKIHHLEALKKTMCIKPVINQTEMHPGYYDIELLDYCRSQDIIIEASSPLGSGQILANEGLIKIASAKNKSAAQICLRWAVQRNMIVIPKTSSPKRLKENAEIFNFTLSDEEVELIDNIPFCGGLVIDPDEVTEFG